MRTFQFRRGSGKRFFTSALSALCLLALCVAPDGTRAAAPPAYAPSLTAITLSPTSVTGGTNSTGKVTLSAAPAPGSGGLVITLTSNHTAASVPPTVAVAEGQTSATFTVTTSPVAADTPAVVTAEYAGVTKTATLTVKAPSLLSVKLSPASVTGGVSSAGTVTLTGAPVLGSGGVAVTLASSDPSAGTVSTPTVTVPEGQTTATFTVNTNPVAAKTVVTVTGVGGGVTKTAKLTVNPPAPKSVAFSPSALTGGLPSTGTVTLTGAAPAGGATVTLSSDNVAATLPATTIVVPAGATTQTFAVQTSPVASDTIANVTATAGGVSKAGKLTVKVPTLSSLSLSPTSTAGGLNVTGTVTLTGQVAAGGSVTVALTSANTSLVSVPATVTVPAGQNSITFTITTTPVTVSMSVSVTAKTTTPAVSKSATLKLLPPALSSLALNPASVIGGSPSTGTVTLTGPAPSGGTVVTLTSSKPTVATVPASVTVAAGNTAATFTITSIAQPANVTSTTSTITAKLGSVSKTATLTVTKTNTPPTANAGPDQARKVGETVQLDASASSDPEGQPLTYAWSFISKPAGSSATLSSAAAVNPTFTIDVYGQYVLQLVVNDGVQSSAPDNVTVNTANTAPVADAGPDQTRKVGETVQLSGAGSTDVDGQALTYSWALTEKPAGSSATLSDPTVVSPTFVKDVKGTYKARLVVNDGIENSAPDEVVINHGNTAPVADAGPDQTRKVGETVQLSGAGSTDVDGDALTYAWSLVNKPAGSAAVLSNPAAVSPTFTKDKPGLYVAQLIVNDGASDSAADTVTINHENTAPVADAGADQTVSLGATVQLSGAGSADSDGDALTYTWSFVSKPAGSAATLSNATSANPTFVADLGGSYVAQLIVNDGMADSAPVTVTVSTDYVPPIAAAGPDQHAVLVGSTVQLDGSGSSSPAGNPLTYKWSLLTKPSGSTAALSSTSAVNPTFVVDKVGTYVAQLIVNDGVQDSLPDTVEVNTPRIFVTLNNPSLLTTAKTTGKAHLDVPAPTGGQTVFLALNNGSLAAIKGAAGCPNGADCVVIPEGQKDSPDFDLYTTTTTGSAVITGFADGFIDGTAGFGIGQRQMKLEVLAPNPKFIGVGRTTRLTLTLTNPAPACPAGTPFACTDGVTVNTVSSANGVATVTPASVALGAGATTQEFIVTGVTSGAATFTSTATGYGQAASPTVTVTSTDLIYIPISQTVAPGQTLSYPISLSKPAPASGVTVKLESANTGVATVSPATVTIPAGATAPTTQPQVTGVALGTTSVTATDMTPVAPGDPPLYAGDTQPVNVSLSLNFSTPSVTVLIDNTKEIELNLSAPAPAGGVTINLSTDNTTRATVPATVTFAQGESTKNVTVTGVTVGSTTLRASGTGISEVTAAVTVNPAPAITLSGVTVGKDLQTTTAGSLAAVAPAGNLQVTITSADETKVLLSKTPNGAGSKSITVEVGAGSASVPSFYVQGLAASGSVTLTAKAPDYANGTSTVTLTPSGFRITSGNITTTSSSPNTAITVGVARLAPVTLAYAETQPLRAGLADVSVTVASSDTTVGEITTSPVVFHSGESSNTTSFDPIGGGTATISLTQPAGFSTPSAATQITATVTAPGLTISGVTVGKDLQTSSSGSLAAPAPAGNLNVTVTSLDPSKVLLSKTATTAGSSSIVLQVPAGTQSIPTFYVQALASAGAVQIKATAPGFTQHSVNVDLRPSGFMLSPYGTCVNCYQNNPTLGTTTFSGNTNLYVVAAVLDPSTLNYYTTQSLRPGVTASVEVLSSNTSTGTITSSPVAFGVNDYYKTTAFDPNNAGTSVVSLGYPAGWSVPNNYKTVTFDVRLPNTSLGSVVVGKDLQTSTSASLEAAAPAGNVTMTITVADPTKALLSTSTTSPGTSSLTFTIFAGNSSAPTFYVQGLSNTGTVNYTVSATTNDPALPDYNSTTATISLYPSGFMLSPYGTCVNCYQNNPTLGTTTFSGNTNLYVVAAVLDPSTLNYYTTQSLRPGVTASVEVLSSNTSTGTITSSPVAFGVNDYYKTTAFDPNNAGTSVVSLGYPAGWSVPNNYKTATFTVTAPNTSLGSVVVGKDLQTSTSASLAVGAPSGGVTMTVTVADPSKALLSKDPNTVGTGTLTFDIAAGYSGAPTFYVQALAGTGTVQYTVTAPGFNSKTATISLYPSGFVLGQSTCVNCYQNNPTLGTTTFSGNTSLYVVAAVLDPSTLNYYTTQSLRPGATATLDVTSSDTSVGTIVPPTSFALDSVGGNHGTLYGATFAAGHEGQAFNFDGVDDYVSFGYPALLDSPPALTLDAWVNPNDLAEGQEMAVLSRWGYGTAYDSYMLSLKKVSGTVKLGGFIGVQNSADAGLFGGSVTPNTWSHVAMTYDSATGDHKLYVNGQEVATRVRSGGIFNSSNLNIELRMGRDNSSSRTYKGKIDEAEAFNRVLSAAELQNIYAGTLATNPVSRWKGEDQPFTFGANQNYRTIYFDPASAGTTTVSVTPPANWSHPSNYQQVSFTVTAPNTNLSSVVVGKDLQTGTSASLAVGAPSGGVTMTITVADPSKALLSKDPNTVGTGTLTFDIAAGYSGAPTFYVQALAGTGTVQYTVTAPGFNSKTATITLYPSGFVLGQSTCVSCYQSNSSISTTTFSGNTNLYVVAAVLDPSTLNYYTTQSLRPGAAASVNVTSSDTSVGTITSSPLSFGTNEYYKGTYFDPSNEGTAVAGVSTPAGWSTPSNYQQVTVTVTKPGISLSNVLVGKDLQTTASAQLNVAAPAGSGGVTMTITVADPSKALLSKTQTAAGSSSITFNIPEGQTWPGSYFYVQALAGSGSVSYTVSAPGYESQTATITLYPSGFIFEGQTSGFQTTVGASDTTLRVIPAVLDPVNFNYYTSQELRPGMSNTQVTVTSNNTSVGTVTVSPVVFNGVDNPYYRTTSFHPVGTGSAVLKVTGPAGFSQASNYNNITATVNQ